MKLSWSTVRIEWKKESIKCQFSEDFEKKLVIHKRKLKDEFDNEMKKLNENNEFDFDDILVPNNVILIKCS